MRKHRVSHPFSKTLSTPSSSAPSRRPPTPAPSTFQATPLPSDHSESVPTHLRKWAATSTTTSLLPHRSSADSVSQPSQTQGLHSISDSSYSSFAFLAASSAPQPSVDSDNSTFASSTPARERQSSNPSPRTHPQRHLPTPLRSRRHHSLQNDSPSSPLLRLRPARDRDRDRYRDRNHSTQHSAPSVGATTTNPDSVAGPAILSTSFPNILAATKVVQRAPRSNTDIPNNPRSDSIFTQVQRFLSLPSRSRRRSHTPPIPTADSFTASAPLQYAQPAAAQPAPVPNPATPIPTTSEQPLTQNLSRDGISQPPCSNSESSGALANSGAAPVRDAAPIEGTRRSSMATVSAGPATAAGIAGRTTRKAIRVLPGRSPLPSATLPSDGAGNAAVASASTSNRVDFDTESAETLQIRLRILENELEASRVRLARQRKRIQQLEDESSLSRQALPALETIIKSALTHFNAKEAALKHTIIKVHQEMATVVAEKNEALRLLATFVGRSARSPPASFSSLSEAGGEFGGVVGRDGRRSGSTSTGTTRRTAVVDHSYERSMLPHSHDRGHDSNYGSTRVTTR